MDKPPDESAPLWGDDPDFALRALPAELLAWVLSYLGWAPDVVREARLVCRDWRYWIDALIAPPGVLTVPWRAGNMSPPSLEGLPARVGLRAVNWIPTCDELMARPVALITLGGGGHPAQVREFAVSGDWRCIRVRDRLGLELPGGDVSYEALCAAHYKYRAGRILSHAMRDIAFELPFSYESSVWRNEMDALLHALMCDQLVSLGMYPETGDGERNACTRAEVESRTTLRPPMVLTVAPGPNFREQRRAWRAERAARRR